MSNNNINISDFVPVFNQFKNKPKDTIKYESLSFVVTVTNGYNADGAALDFSGYKPTYKELIAYDHLINKGNGTYNLTGKGFDETLKNLPQVVLKYKSQVTKLAKHLYSSNYKQACFNIWHFLTKNIKYKIDKPGYEEMRSPARAWHDRFTGIDCDCFSIFSACLLIEMNYYPHFQIVAFNNKPDYGHIYVIEKNIILDCVMKKFNQEPDNVTKKLNLMIQNVILNGPDSGIVQILMNEQKKLKEIINSGNATAAVFKELKKVKFLILCAEHEAHTHLIELMHYVDDINADGNFIYKNATINSILSHVDGLGNIESSLGEVEASEDDIDEMEDIAGILEEIEEIEETPLEGLGDLGRRHARKRAARKAKRAARKTKRAAIKFNRRAKPKRIMLKRLVKKLAPRNIIKTIKKVNKFGRKFSPAHIIARAAKKKFNALRAKRYALRAKRYAKRIAKKSNVFQEEPTYEAPFDEEPTDEEPTYEAPFDEEPTDEEPTYESSFDEEPTDEPSFDGELTDETLEELEKRLHNKIKSGRFHPNDVKELKKTRTIMMTTEPGRRAPHLELMNHVEDIDSSGNYVFKNKTINAILEHCDGLGNLDYSIGEIMVNNHDIEELNSIGEILDEMEDFENTPLEGLGDLGRRHARKRAARKAKRAARRAARKAAGKTIKQKLRRFIKKTGSIIKKVSRKIRKFNPAFAIPRAAFLGLLNLNAFNLAFKLSIGYKTQAEAEKDGMDINEWKKAVNATAKVEKFFEKTGGSIAQLRKAVKKGRYRKEAKAEKTRVKGFKGLGFAIAGAITAAGSLLAKIFGFLKKVNFKKLGRKVFNKIKGSKTDVENEIDMDNINTMNPNNPTNTTSNNSSLIWILLGGCALAFFALKK